MKPIAAIVFKDIVIELRSKESISSMLMFGILVLVIFLFAFESRGVDKNMIGPGELWVAFSFAAILGLNRTLAMEIDNDCLQGLLLAAIRRGGLYLGKVACNFSFILIAELIVLPVFFVFNNLNFDIRFFGIIAVSI